MGKIRYICTKCANGFTTLGAANRHLKKVENGIGTVVTESDFRIGLSTGVYLPVVARKRPPYKKAPLDLWAIAGEEYHRAFWRKAGEWDCEQMLKDPVKAKALNVIMEVFRAKEFMKLASE